jgi:hypothetical protein
MTWRGFRGTELAFWAIWLGALWFMAILVAPGLFKWLPRPEAGLVAGRLFYMLALYSLFTSAVLLFLSNFVNGLRAGTKVNVLMAVISGVCVLELAWLHPHMNELREGMSTLQGDDLAEMRSRFGNIHALSTVLYSIKMIGALVWGLSRYGVNQAAEA